MSEMPADIVVNTRTLSLRMVGAMRYTDEIVRRLGGAVDRAAPGGWKKEIKGHAWEQFALPRMVGKRLLWSPSNSGPLSVRRQVVTVHDMVPFDQAATLNWRFAAWHQWLRPRLVRRVAAIITVSEFTKERLIDLTGIPADRVTVVHNGVGGQFSPQPGATVDRARAALNIPSAHYILSVCTIEPRKNIPRLLEAWRSIADQVPSDIWLVLAGGQGNPWVFRAAGIDEMPARVHFTGHVPDESLPALFSGALALVYPSLYEGFGLPALEAMACGCPVITSNVTSLPEVCGDAAVLFDPFSVDEIAQALQHVIDDGRLRQALTRKGLLRARGFSWDKTAAETRAVLEGVAQCR